MAQTDIPTAEIIRERLCLVCAREGVRKPVQEHECWSEHFVATLAALNGRWAQFLDGCACELSDRWDSETAVFTLITKPTKKELYDYAIDVGGFKRDAAIVNGKPMSLAGEHPCAAWGDTPREAILRAKMAQLWEQLEVSDGQ